MGGSAIEKFGTSTRLDPDSVSRILEQILSALPDSVRKTAAVPRNIARKTSFGDIDLVGDFGGMDPESLSVAFGAKGFTRNGPSGKGGYPWENAVVSYAIPVDNNLLFQVDLIHMPKHEMAFALDYFAFGGIGNIIGKVGRYYGFKVTRSGLYFTVEDPSGQERNLLATRNFDETLAFLGYDPEAFHTGFETESKLFAYLTRSPLFTRDIFTEENLRHRDRVREKKRPAIQAFMENTEQLPSRTPAIERDYYRSEQGYQELVARFPSIQEDYLAVMSEMKEQKMLRDRFNGTIVQEITGLTGVALGQFISEYKKPFGQDFNKWIRDTAPEEIRLRVLARHAFASVPEGMTAYVVGGAVRNALMGLPVKDIDYVVVGESANSMLKKGFTMVGRDFPVFLDKNGREFALARREKSVGDGHRGFVTDTADVTLEEDLFRRDLTVNSIAMAPDGTLIDPYGGKNDIDSGILRAVSDHFAEDPLRVLRVARLAAMMEGTDHPARIDENLMEAMRKIVSSGALSFLSAERVFGELERCLLTDHPEKALTVLSDCGALACILPEVDALHGVPQPVKWHPEGDAFVHTLQVLAVACKLSPDPAVRFAAMVHDVGKALSPPEKLPAHHNHDTAGLPLVKALCDRLKVPAAWKKLALVATEVHLKVHRVQEMKPSTLHDLLVTMGAMQDARQFENILSVCQSDASGRSPLSLPLFVASLEHGLPEYHQADYLRRMAKACRKVNGEQIMEELKSTRADMAFPGPHIGTRLRDRRISEIRKEKSRENASER